VAEEEVPTVLHHCHASTYGRHFGIEKTIAKVIQAGLHWPMMFKDAREFFMTSDRCQRTENIFKRHKMPQSDILEI